MDLKLNI